MNNGVVYFAKTVSYIRNMFMKLAYRDRDETDTALIGDYS